ncbi:Pr6Pr family membrane protein [Spiroplasma monobiae]|uniref:Transmembrane protein n=1 Tax=Spiroplasma monobiae MQ-1 TaxID=1336748 RepID=A0A2K9LUH1_SPISQ|nr:Pr6Pr family membrane protein [Spiroplasma monobiae]AUM62703.1 hypothetical protein SMONO_v1c04540 [Spiroplasma monobiae MQ-1]
MFITKQNLKDWRLWYKLTLSLLITIFLLEMLIKGMVNISEDIKNSDGTTSPSIWTIYGNTIGEDGKVEILGYDYFGYVINFFSFFTIQSNILIAVWMFVGFLNHNKEGQIKLLQKAFSLSVVTYITVTALIFNGMLLPQVLATGKEFGALWWVEQMVVHTFGPIAAVVYFLLFMKQELEFNFKKFISRDFLFLAIYPVIYLIGSLLKGEMIYRAYGGDSVLARKHQAYPYFFLEIHNKQALSDKMGETLLNNGLFWMFMAIIIIVGIIIGLGSLYLYIGSKTSNIRNNWANNEQTKTKAK